MSNVISFEEYKNRDFKAFINENKNSIYATTPQVNSISADDEWADEAEWDDLFEELSLKEKYGLSDLR